MTDHTGSTDDRSPQETHGSDPANRSRQRSAGQGRTRSRPSKNGVKMGIVLTTLGTFLGAFLVWATAVKNFLGLGVYITGSVISQVELGQKYVPKDDYNGALARADQYQKEADALRKDLAAATNQLAWATASLADQHRSTQVRAQACQQLAVNVIELQDRQKRLENEVTGDTIPGISKPTSAYPQSIDQRRHSSLLQQQILEATQDFVSACAGATAMPMP